MFSCIYYLGYNVQLCLPDMPTQQLVAVKHIYKICIGNINFFKNFKKQDHKLPIINLCIYVFQIDLFFNNLLHLRRLGYDRLDSVLYEVWKQISILSHAEVKVQIPGKAWDEGLATVVQVPALLKIIQLLNGSLSIVKSIDFLLWKYIPAGITGKIWDSDMIIYIKALHISSTRKKVSY